MSMPGPHLRDIHPPTVSWWPLAWGWWLVAAVLCVGLVALVLGLYRWIRRRRRLHAVTRSIEQALADFHRHGDVAVFAATLSQWLRRAGRLHAPHAERLQGGAWQAFLREHAPRGGDIDALDGLEAAIYRPGASLDETAATAAVEAWVRHALARS